MNEARNSAQFCAVAQKQRLESLLRIAHEQYPHKSPEDQAHERRFMARDFESFEADLRAKQEPLGADFEKVLNENPWKLYAR